MENCNLPEVYKNSRFIETNTVNFHGTCFNGVNVSGSDGISFIFT